jgi:hypothetical protein
MPQKPSSCSPRRAHALSIPDDLKLGAALLAGLQGRGLLQRVQEWLPLSRRAGHGVGALFAFALVYLAAGRRWGIRPFALAFDVALNGLLAPLVGLHALPTAASVSRALGTLKHAAVRSFVDRLLTSDPETSAVLASPHVRHRDANGRGWHVLDFDPTIEAFRQRGLPQDVSLPESERLAPGTPGYTGHKRGELRIRHLPLQHAGSAVWLAYRLDATGGSLLPFLSELLRVGRATLDRVSPGDIVVRADGEFGSVGAMRTCLAAQVHVLTRLCRYALLDRAEVRAAMATASWRKVVSAGGGPTREAADLGLFTLYPDADAKEADGGPVEVRVVVTRFPRSSPPEHGVLQDGFQVELFATSLPADAWPAEEVVTLYFGRGAMENCFAQEDREIGIDRTFSYHPPGQEWMSGVGLFLWNLLIGRGVAATPLPPEVPAQEARVHSAEADPPSPAVAASLCVDARHEPDGTPESVASREPSVDHEPLAESAAVPDGTRDEERELRQELWSIARKAFDTLPLPDGWTLHDERAEAQCPNGERLFVCAAESETRARASGEPRMKHRIMLRTDTRACNGCPLRAECTSAERNVYKQVTRSISGTEVLRSRELLTRLKKFTRKEQIRRINKRRDARRPVDAPAQAPLRPLRTAAVALPPGPLHATPPLFLPATSRQLVRDLLRRVGVEIVLAPTKVRRLPAHPLLAATAAARRHQRLTWTQRTNRWIYSGEASLSLGGIRGLPPSLRAKVANMLAL